MWLSFSGKVAYNTMRTRVCCTKKIDYVDGCYCWFRMLFKITETFCQLKSNAWIYEWTFRRCMCGTLTSLALEHRHIECVRSRLLFYYVGAVAAWKSNEKIAKCIMWSIATMTNASARACERASVFMVAHTDKRQT